MLRPVTCVCALLSALAVARSVQAQAPSPDAEAPPTEEVVEERSLAHEAYLQARAAFERKDFDAALRLLRLAAQEDEQPVYVYNMARVLETTGRNGEAYSSFLRVRALPAVTSPAK